MDTYEDAQANNVDWEQKYLDILEKQFYDNKSSSEFDPGSDVESDRSPTW